jgi:transcriptional regulator with XRE-family HTH domain
MHAGERLKEERERLGFNQADFAAVAGATRKTLFNWESGAASPNAAALASWAEAGLDVLYVVTGQRSQPVPPAQELPRQEQEWLALYRNSSEEVRAALKAAGNELTKPARARGKAA